MQHTSTKMTARINSKIVKIIEPVRNRNIYGWRYCLPRKLSNNVNRFRNSVNLGHASENENRRTTRKVPEILAEQHARNRDEKMYAAHRSRVSSNQEVDLQLL